MIEDLKEDLLRIERKGTKIKESQHDYADYTDYKKKSA